MTSIVGDFDLAGVIRAELLQVLYDAPALEPKDIWVEKKLDQMLGHHDWSQSFSRGQAIIYDEVLPSEILIIIHQWLRRKCADIENIKLFVTHHTGLARWWEDWCKINQTRSFRIEEIFFTARPTPTPSFKSLRHREPLARKTVDFFLENKKINKVFSYYGGSYSSREREYLLLKLLGFRNHAYIDFLGHVSSKQEVLSYVEYITFYKNQQEVDLVSARYDAWITQKVSDVIGQFGQAKKNEDINFQDRQWLVDRQCFASVVRETSNSDRFACVTEKTLRAFLHHCVVVPIGYKAVDGLENKGFWFPHDLIDYSYQFHDLFSDRVSAMIRSIDRLVELSRTQLQDYYLNNVRLFQHNAQLILEKIDHNTLQSQTSNNPILS